MFSKAYRKAKVRLHKGRERRTYFLKISRGSTSQHTEKKIAGGTHPLIITEGKTYQGMEREPENHTYFLDRAKEEFLGHEKKVTREGHSLSGEGRSQD